MTDTIGRHSMDSPEWYTPAPFVEAARDVMGAIDLDPASHAEANVIVKAGAYFTREINGLDYDWFGRVFLNPPGGDVETDGKSRSLVSLFWSKLVEEVNCARVSEAVWIGYSLEQLQTLQRTSVRTPLDYTFCIPERRIAFVENEMKKAARIAKQMDQIAKGERKTVTSGTQPSHGNYIAYLGPNSGRFAEVFIEFGQVVVQ